ncbi:MAG: hypothetical protein AAF661_05005 [Pseudomonadota bacterium]
MRTHRQVSFAGGVIGEEAQGRIDVAKYQIGIADGQNVFVQPQGILSSRAGTEFVADIGEAGAVLLPFKFDETDQYVLVFTNLALRFVKQGQLGFIQSSGDYTVVTPYVTADLANLKFVQKDDILYLVHPLYAPRQLSRTSDTNWTLSTLTFAPSIAAPTGLAVALGGGSGGTAPRDSVYVVTAVSEDGEESLPSSSAQYATPSSTLDDLDLTWNTVAGTDYYRVYKEENGVFGYIGEAGSNAFTDDGINADTTDSPPGDRNPFSTSDDYPGVVERFQQRFVYGNKFTAPLKTEWSQTGFPENFTFSNPQRATDAIELTPDVRTRSEIRALVAGQSTLVCFTANSVLRFEPTDGNVAKPGEISIEPDLQIGCSPVQPIIVGAEILFVEDAGDRIHSIDYDAVRERLTPLERSILAYHYFRGREVVAFSYARTPYSIIPTVVSNGIWPVMTYVEEQDVWGWTEWLSRDSSGLALATWSATIREGKRDVPYYVLTRTIDGSTVYYLEKLADREETVAADFIGVDSAVVGTNGSPSTTLSGATHLVGETVDVLGDGNVFLGLTVDGSGNVEIDLAVSKYVIGLRNEWLVETLPPPPGREKLKLPQKVFVDTIGDYVFDAVGLKDNGEELDTSRVKMGGLREVVIEGNWTADSRIRLKGNGIKPFKLRQVHTRYDESSS